MPRAPAIPTRSGALMPPPPSSGRTSTSTSTSTRRSRSRDTVSYSCSCSCSHSCSCSCSYFSSVGRVGQDETVDNVGAEAGELEAAPGVLDLVGRPAPAAGLLFFQEEMALLPVRTEVRERDIHRATALAVQDTELDFPLRAVDQAKVRAVGQLEQLLAPRDRLAAADKHVLRAGHLTPDEGHGAVGGDPFDAPRHVAADIQERVGWAPDQIGAVAGDQSRIRQQVAPVADQPTGGRESIALALPAEGPLEASVPVDEDREPALILDAKLGLREIDAGAQGS